MITLHYRPVEMSYQSGRKKLDAYDITRVKGEGLRATGEYLGTAIIEPEDKTKYGSCGGIRLRMMGRDGEILCPGAKFLMGNSLEKDMF